MQDSTKLYQITVTGDVQGVGFRYHTRRIADRFGLSGWVKNMPDGSVYIEAEGQWEVLERFVDWLHEGPARARVHHVEVDRTDRLKNFDGFDVRF